MSAHGHDHGHESEMAEAHAHDDHEHDSDALAPDEPHTPSWLPLLGAGLFLAALLFYVVTRPEPGSEETGSAEAAPAAAAPAPPAPAPPAPGNPAAIGRPKPQMPGHEGHNH